MLLGPLDGIPYKVYVTQLGLAGAPAWLVLAASVPARLERFLVVVVLCALIGRFARRRIAARPRLVLLVYLGVWALQYAFYAWSLKQRFGGG